MKALLSVPLNGPPDQVARLRALQAAFADVCNAIAPIVQSTRCWNRVALHHLVYRPMRERFPALGSQMICNAIYSVSRTARLVLQHPASPFNIAKQPPNAPLPLFRFAPTAPVYFDRHTLSVKGNVLSMFTLDGRIRFALQLQPDEIARFHTDKLLEIVLSANPQGYRLTFQFAGTDSIAPNLEAADKPAAATQTPRIEQHGTAAEAQQLEQQGAGGQSTAGQPSLGMVADHSESAGSFPEYLVVIPPETAAPIAIPPAMAAERVPHAEGVNPAAQSSIAAFQPS